MSLYTTKDNLKYILYKGNYIDDIIIKNGHFEKHIYDIINKYVKSTDVCLDIGANFGAHAVHMGSKCKKVICIEPMNIKTRLKQNLELNNINYEIYDCLLSDTEKELVNVFRPSLWNNSDDYSSKKEVSRKVETIDLLIKEKIDFIKLDVDGMESQIIRGMEKTIKKYKPIIVTELCIYYIDDKNKFKKNKNIEFMKKLWIETVEIILEKGYRVSYIAYTNEKIINSSDFGNLYEKLRNRGLSSTDVLFIPY